MRIQDGKALPTVTATAILGFFEEYRWLSNFYYSEVVVNGLSYETSEHAYQALKTKSAKVRLEIQRHPLKGLKAYCRSIKIRKGWDDGLRIKAMWKVVKSKFSQNPTLQKNLLATYPLILEERNTWGDRYWGTCLVQRKYVGENMLGQVLMAYRDYCLGKVSPHVVDDYLLEILKEALRRKCKNIN